MTKLGIAMSVVLVCGCGDSTADGGGGSSAGGNGGGGAPATDPVEVACVASCEAYNACHPGTGDCDSGCAGIGQVTEAAGGTCSDDVLTVFECASGAADCDALDGRGLELGFGCIDQYCEAHPQEPARTLSASAAGPFSLRIDSSVARRLPAGRASRHARLPKGHHPPRQCPRRSRWFRC